MRHHKAGLKLNRTPSHRNAMFRNMVTSLFKYDRIRTTGAKAMELRRWADHIITLAKRGDLHARRQALAIVKEKDVVHKLFENAAERFGDISGGYTRVIKLGRRPGDAAPVSLIELVVLQDTKKKKTKKKKTKTEAAPKKAAPKKAAAGKKVADKGEEKKEKAAKKKSVPVDKEDASAVKAAKPDEKKTEAAAKEEAETAKEEKPAAKAVPEEPAAAEEEGASDTRKAAKDEE